MKITVSRLISQLRRYPKNAVIAVQEHDQSPDEVTGFVHGVDEADESIASQYNLSSNIVILKIR